MAIGASNKFAVEANRGPDASSVLDPNSAFAPSSMTYHGIAIEIPGGNGQAGVRVGRITSFTTQQLERTFTHIRELNPATSGQPVDGVPGNADGFELAFARAEVWSEEVEQAFGVSADPLLLLTNQNKPFILDEVYFKGSELYKRYRYLGCWFTSKNTDAFDSGGDQVVRISGVIKFVNKIRA